LEVEGRKSEINASLAKANAEASRKLVDQLNAEADAIEENVKKVEAEEVARKSAPEYRKLTKQEKYDDERNSKKEKDAAVQMVIEKRNLARQEIENVKNREQVAQTLRATADINAAISK